MLDFSSNPEIRRLYLQQMKKLEYFDVTNNAKLERLYLSSSSNIIAIDLTQNTNLLRLAVSWNSTIQELDLSNNIALRRLYLTELGGVTELDLSNLSNLEILEIRGFEAKIDREMNLYLPPEMQNLSKLRLSVSVFTTPIVLNAPILKEFWYSEAFGTPLSLAQQIDLTDSIGLESIFLECKCELITLPFESNLKEFEFYNTFSRPSYSLSLFNWANQHKLTKFKAVGTNFSELDLPSNLTEIDLENNSFSTFEVPKAAKTLQLESNNLTEIDLSFSLDLESLILSENKLTNLDNNINNLLAYDNPLYKRIWGNPLTEEAIQSLVDVTISNPNITIDFVDDNED